MEIVDIRYDFYKDYLEKPRFQSMFTNRTQSLKNTHNLPDSSDEYIVKNYFVELFSWTVFPIDLLHSIDQLLYKNIPNYTIIDPCSGSSFHGALFQNFCNRDVISIDIQPEQNSWMSTIENDGLNYLKILNNMTIKNDITVLLLSWVDWTDKELTYNLLMSFKGNYVISVGNYTDIDNKRYLDELRKNYSLIKGYICNMPWKSSEEIKIFKKNE